MFTAFFTAVASCIIAGQGWITCFSPEQPNYAMQETTQAPILTGDSLGVLLTAESALAWDIDTGTILYEKNSTQERPIASLSKLLSVLAVRENLAPGQEVVISKDVLRPQRLGANIKLPVDETTTVRELLEASLVASANDAIVALAVATSGTEEDFVAYANNYAPSIGVTHTVLSNATGLSGGIQHSTAQDVRRLLTLVYEDSLLGDFIAEEKGVLTTKEGHIREYDTTNKLLGTYMPILGAKTGYTVEAKENLALITRDDAGHRIGTVILGSDDRFQDSKALVQWIWENYTFN